MNIDLKHNDCLIGMQSIATASIDVILTDPPYKYLKNQKLEVDFDEDAFFAEAKRVLKSSGFVLIFGRGKSFYRWNTILDSLGFLFKEEIIWDKSMTTSPVGAISRVHETIAIYSLGASLKQAHVPYLEAKSYDIDKMASDIKRICSALNSPTSLQGLVDFINDKKRITKQRRSKYNLTVNLPSDTPREINTLCSITRGMREKSIIRVLREHYKSIHPTQKPTRLIERLLALVSNEGDLVLDPFAGSASTAIACINTNRQFRGFEIDAEYYARAKSRIEEAKEHKKQHTSQMAFEYYSGISD